ncbi:sulfate adenylyltransferase subunit CysN [Oligoflexus tunisiensis]|uniref:sulfate adenylyltransferase subunit CysN n=1 Tax=Oligoflexus tunisiensis TaxID=708132 RepID=UPI000AADC833|nr:sulfate adenylyltransferase subunit CysN [Oligoflexus tunisiensis]
MPILKDDKGRSLLRISTAGSVDDGKSTLIGRLLHDTKGLYEDQLAALQKNKLTVGGAIDFAAITDGLRAEREQGITIDVAYRYFSTQKRHFILADTPGHEQYTRNMATGASTSSLAIVLIDARHGITVQTKRHAFISSLLEIPRIIVAINKMDLVGWSEQVYEDIKTEFTGFASRLNIRNIDFIPVSALLGDNIVNRSQNTPWYSGPTIIQRLEDVYVESDQNMVDFRFPVQLVQRPHQDFRGYAGTIAAGVIHAGDEVVILPSGQTSRIRAIHTFDGELETAFAPMSVTLTLADAVDISRGDMIVRKNNVPQARHEFEAMMIWMSAEPLVCRKNYLVRHTTRYSNVMISDIKYMVKIDDLSSEPADGLRMNEIGRVSLTSALPLFVDTYQKIRQTGSFILVDPISHETVAAGMIIDRAAQSVEAVGGALHLTRTISQVSVNEREERQKYRGITFWFTGLSGSGKSTIAAILERRLFDAGINAMLLDGDNLRLGLCQDLGFDKKSRSENLRRAAEVAHLCNQAGLVVIASFISPFKSDREIVRACIGDDRYFEIFVDTPLEICEQRDVKGLYKKARAGEIKSFTGIDSPFERPEQPSLQVSTEWMSADECVELIVTASKELLYSRDR